jgi:hypothetical protein
MADDDTPESSEPESFAAEPATEDGRRANERKAGRIRREQREAQAFWKAVFDSEVGRREIWRKVFSAEASHTFETRFLSGAVGFPDPNASWYARGEQDLGLRLFHTLQALNPDGVLAMQREHDPRFVQAKRIKAGE